MSDLTDRTISALREDRDALAALVVGLDDDDLARDSGSTAWDVAQVLSHLGSGSEIGLAGLHAALGRAPEPAPDFNSSVWDRWNAMGRREQAEAFLIASEAYVGAFEELDAATREGLEFNLPFLPVPAGLELVTGMRLTEALLHSWDVRVAFDPDATIPAGHAGVLFDQLRGPVGFMLGFLGKPPAVEATTIRLQLIDPDRAAVLVIGQRAAWAPDDAAHAALLTGTTESFLRLLSGRLSPARTPRGFVLTGGTMRLDDLRAAFPGY